MRITEVLREEHILVPLAAQTLREGVLALIQRLGETGAITRPDRLERLMSDERVRDVVHVGERVLLPHLRTDAVDHLLVAIGVASEPLQLPQATERGREQVIVLVLAPPEAANQYLQVVSALARGLRNEAVVEALAASRSPAEVLALPEIRQLAVQPRLVVRDVMTHRVIRVSPDTQVHDLMDLLRRHKIESVPVIGDKWEVLGVVTDRDLLRHLMPAISRAGSGEAASHLQHDSLYSTPVREIMTRSVMCVSEDQPLVDVVSSMINKNVDHLPVVHEGRLTGFIARTDIFRKLFPS